MKNIIGLFLLAALPFFVAGQPSGREPTAKEQALINGATARNPSAAVLERAMGYACPDSANGGCDPAYAGVGNQVFWASWQ